MPAAPRRTHPAWLVPALVVALAAALIALVIDRSGSDDAGPGTAETGPSAGSPTAEEDDREQPAPDETPGTGGDAVDPGAAAPEVEQPVSDFSFVERRDDSDLLAVGPVDAPVVLVVFSDYQCPFCARWSTDTLPSMLDRAEAGEVRIEWRDVNIFGPESERASRATYAAAKQGKFLEYHDALFAGGETRSAAELSQEALVELAGELGLDTVQFRIDLDAVDTLTQIEENAQLGLGIGAFSTPTFILAGEPIVGAQPTQVFVDAVEAALAEVP